MSLEGLGEEAELVPASFPARMLSSGSCLSCITGGIFPFGAVQVCLRLPRAVVASLSLEGFPSHVGVVLRDRRYSILCLMVRPAREHAEMSMLMCF